MTKLMYDVVIIGGGAAGMLASICTARRGLKTLLLDHSEYLGRKLGITGKGRCNLTNNCSVREVIDSIPTGGKFMQSALNTFTPQDAMTFFEDLGVPLKTERGNRVFPVSDKARDVVDALKKAMRKSGVTVRNAHVTAIATENGAVTGVMTDDEEIRCSAAVLCTGGVSYPLTGSTGDGYNIARALGHTVAPPKASLVPLVSPDEFCTEMQGLALKNVQLTIRDGGKKPVFEDFGEVLFTHFGLSGPLVLSASANMRDYEHKSYVACIDLKPAMDEKKLDARLLRDFEKFANRDFANALSELLNRLMIPVVVRRSGIPPDTKVHSITKEQRRTLLALLKCFDIAVGGPRPVDEAIVTSGGISTREINPKTMESKLINNLHFAGEVIDADAYTGGFNLQIAWSTAYAAAAHILTNKE